MSRAIEDFVLILKLSPGFYQKSLIRFELPQKEFISEFPNIFHLHILYDKAAKTHHLNYCCKTPSPLPSPRFLLSVYSRRPTIFFILNSNTDWKVHMEGPTLKIFRCLPLLIERSLVTVTGFHVLAHTLWSFYTFLSGSLLNAYLKFQSNYTLYSSFSFLILPYLFICIYFSPSKQCFSLISSCA